MAKKSKTQRAKASAARAQRKQAREELGNESPASENVKEVAEEKPKRSLFKKDTDSKETAEKSAAKAVSKDKKDAKPKKKRFQFFRDVKAEMKRVTWPTKQDVARWSVVVVCALIFFGVYVAVLETMGLENNVFAIEIPTEMVTEIKEGGRRVESEKKVFPGYVLVRMELDDRSWAAVRNTPGVTGFVGSDGKPAPLTRDEYNKIMKRTSHEAPKKTSTTLEVGQTIKVVSGPLAEFDGVISEVAPESGKVKVMVSIFGRETPVELSFDQVARI